MIKIRLKNTKEQEVCKEIEVNPEWTVSRLKDTISSKIGIPQVEQRLVYQGRLLKDHSRLQDLAVKSGDLLVLVPLKPKSPSATKEPRADNKILGNSSQNIVQNTGRLLSSVAGEESQSFHGLSPLHSRASLEDLCALMPPELQEFSNHLMDTPELREQLMSMFTSVTTNQGNGANLPGSQSHDPHIPIQQLSREEASTSYAAQLTQMSEMGFSNHEENLTLLIKAHGNVELALSMKLDDIRDIVKMDMRGLSTFIADLRKDSGIANGESHRVKKELAKIRSKFQTNQTLNGYHRKKYVCKLLYINMLGYDVDFGHIEAIKLICSSTLSEKAMGYLACNLLIHQESEMNTLLINQIKIDLCSGCVFHQCLALNFIANASRIASAENTIKDVENIFFNGQLGGRVRKKAAVTLLQLIRSYNDFDSHRIVNSALASLEIGDMGGTNAVLSLLEYISPRVPDQHVKINEKSILILAGIVLEKRTPQDYIYFGVPTPWTQCKLLRIIGSTKLSEDHLIRSYLVRSLSKIFGATEKLVSEFLHKHPKARVNNRINAMNSVFFEAIQVLQVCRENSLISRLSTIITLYLSSPSDSYGIYVGLRALELLTKPMRVQNITHGSELDFIHRKVIDCVYHGDISVQHQSLTVLLHIAQKGNVEEIVGELLMYIPKASIDLQRHIVQTVMAIARTHCINISWIVDIFLSILKEATFSVDRSIWVKVYQLIVENSGSYQYARSAACNALKERPLSEALVVFCTHIIKICKPKHSDPPFCEIEAIKSVLSNFSVNIQGELISCFFTIYQQYRDSDFSQRLRRIFEEICSSPELHLQSMACEYINYITETEGAQKDNILVEDEISVCNLASILEASFDSSESPAQGKNFPQARSLSLEDIFL